MGRINDQFAEAFFGLRPLNGRGTIAWAGATETKKAIDAAQSAFKGRSMTLAGERAAALPGTSRSMSLIGVPKLGLVRFGGGDVRASGQLAPAQATASAPAGIRTGLEGSVTARHTALATSRGCVIGPGSLNPAMKPLTRSA